MVVERPPEVNPPSGRVPGQVLHAIPRSESWRQRNNGSFCVTGLSFGVSRTRAKYSPKGDLGGGPGSQVARPPPWSRQAVAWAGDGPPPALPRASGVFRHGYFLGIFLDFSEHFYFSPFSAMHRQKQTETGTGALH